MVNRHQNTHTRATDPVGHLQGRLFVVAFLACIFAYPLSSYLTDAMGIQSNMLSVLARALTLGLVLLYLGFLFMHRLFRPVPVFYLFVLFWLLYMVRIFHDTLQYGWMLGRPPSDYYLFALVLSFFCSFPFFVPVAIPYRFLEKAAFVVLALLNVLGVKNILSADVLFLERLGGNEKLNPILFGMIAALLAALSVVRLLRPGNTLLFRLINLAAIFTGFFNLVASASKSPVLFFTATLLGLVFYYSRMGNRKSLFLLLGILVAGIGAIFAYGLQDMLLLLLTRFTDISTDTSSFERWEMLSGGFLQFLESPLWGSFLEEKIWHEYPHNLVVEAFMATGVVGGTLFVLYFLGSVRALFRVLFRSGFSFVSLTALSVIILSLFSGGLSFSSDFWICTAAAFALSWQFENEVAPAVKGSMPAAE